MSTTTVTYSYTGGQQTFTVPAGVNSIDVAMRGGTGADGGSGGAPGSSSATIAVVPGETVYIYVAGNGNNNIGSTGGGGGYNGGGRGGNATGTGSAGGYGGGGASDIRIGGSAAANRVLIAGGGGGISAGSRPGGAGGATVGGTGTSGAQGGGGGHGGTQSAGGAGGAAGTGGSAGSAGSTLGGPGGAANSTNGRAGGGGGGGWFGGGGGGGSSGAGNGGGGGGGSNYYAPTVHGVPTSNVNLTQGDAGSPFVSIAYELPPNTPTGIVPVDQTHTMKSGGDTLTLSATVSSPDPTDTVRARFWLSPDGGTTGTYYVTNYVTSGNLATVTISGLIPDIVYDLFCWAELPSGLDSTNSTHTQFYSDLTPSAPNLVFPLGPIDSTIPQKFKWIFEDFDSPSDFQYQALARYRPYDPTFTGPITNLCTNPSFENDATGWSNGIAGASVTSVTEQHYVGTRSLKSVWGTSAALAQNVEIAFTTDYATPGPGSTYTVSAYVYVPTGMPRVQIAAAQAGFSPVGYSTASSVNGSWQRLTYTFTSADADYVFIVVPADAATTGQYCYIDAVLIQKGSLTDYFDGSTADDATWQYDWDGVVNLSTSTKDHLWTTNQVNTTDQFFQFPANTFTPGLIYEWTAKTWDSDIRVGPWANNQQFTASPPVVHMAATAGMSVTPQRTALATSPMAGHAALTVNATHVLAPQVVSMAVTATLNPQPQKTMSLATPIAVSAGMAIVPTLKVNATVPMGATASLEIDGSDQINSQVAMAATGGIIFHATPGELRIVATAGMNIVPAPNSIPGAVAFQASAGMSNTGMIDRSGVTAMAATAGMVVGGIQISSPSVVMAARGSLSVSGGLSRSVPTAMAAKAGMSVQGLLSRSQAVAIVVHSGMTVTPAINKITGLAIGVQAGMTIAGSSTLIGEIAIAATAGMTIVPTGNTIPVVIAMGAHASLTMPNVQQVFPGPYLVDTDSAGDRVSFSTNNFNITNEFTYTNSGAIKP